MISVNIEGKIITPSDASIATLHLSSPLIDGVAADEDQVSLGSYYSSSIAIQSKLFNHPSDARTTFHSFLKLMAFFVHDQLSIFPWNNYTRR